MSKYTFNVNLPYLVSLQILNRSQKSKNHLIFSPPKNIALKATICRFINIYSIFQGITLKKVKSIKS